MPRSPRIDFAGARHHVYNRGARRQVVFHDDDERRYFLSLVARLPERFGVTVHAWCLMSNHYHLLLGTPRGNLSQAMKWVLGAFVQFVNGRHTWDGPMFRGRFANRLVTDEGYWRHLLAYVHLNPVDAGLGTLASVRWTSHRAYVGLERAPAWLSMAEHLDLFGSRAVYQAYVASFEGRDITAEPLDDVGDSQAPEDVDIAVLPPARALAQVCELLRLRPTDLRRPQTKQATFGTWALSASGGFTQQELGDLFGVTRSAISERVRRFEARVESDPEYERWRRLWWERSDALVSGLGARAR